MFGVKQMKAIPNTYIFRYSSGKLVSEGPGISFFYFAPVTTIVSVPMGSVTVPFIFNEVTRDFQSLAAQGQMIYRIADPRKASALLDYTLKKDGITYASDDPETLSENLIGVVQVIAREIIGRYSLKEALTASAEIGKQMFDEMQTSKTIGMIGVEILSIGLQSLSPSPETTRALEAEAREALQRDSDEAIYSRRNSAVEQERIIKENELRTEIAVEEKKRQIRETKMAAEIAIEEQRTQLVQQRIENDRKEADSRAYALEATLKPIRGMDWRVLMAAQEGRIDPKVMIALAFREMAENASKIGEINVTPDLLNSLLSTGKK